MHYLHKSKVSRWGWGLGLSFGLYLLLNIALPYLLVQLLSWGVVRQGRRGRAGQPDQLALTFDDGPDPRYTPQVLQLLKKYNAKATFFLLTAQAEAQPALVNQIIDEGHEIGAHAVRHLHSWRRWPLDAYCDTVQSVSQLRAKTGQPVRLHRPPHGSYTLATILGQRAIAATGAQWSVNGNEWQKQLTANDCLEHILFEVQAGAVVVLHDAGDYAPKTLSLLEPLLVTLQQRGYQLTTLSDLDGAEPLRPQGWPRRLLVSLDRQFDRWYGVVPAANQRNNICRLKKMPFPQPTQQLASGEVIAEGAPVLEMHVNNALLIDLGNKAAVRRAQKDCRAVADWLRHPENTEVQAVFCLSSIGALMRLLRFEDYLLPENGQTRRLQLWTRVLRWGYSGSQALQAAPQLSLSIISRAEFLRLYG